jgi:hypothetical protein
MGVKCGGRVGLTTLRHLLAVCLSNVGALTSRNPRGLTACNRHIFIFFYLKT